MSSRHKIQDTTGVVTATADGLRAHVVVLTSPVGGESGYIPGCIWVNRSGTIGAIFYLNVGSATSATWVAIA